jgi:serine/threonine protein phosphatase PrpC
MIQGTMVSPSSKLRIYSGFSTDVGPVRERNEDALVQRKIPLGYFAAVADGMGGHADGDTAAAITLVSILGEVEKARSDPMEALRKGFEVANATLRRHSQDVGAVMGATCAAAIISSGQLYVGHVGDARLYLLRGANLYSLTRDHSLMQEIADIKGPVAAGGFAPTLRHIMSRSVGAEDEIQPAIRAPVPLATGDAIMLCTDGLSGVVEDRVIRRVLAGGTPREAAFRLVDLAAESGGEDNTTVIVLRVDADVAREESPVISFDELMSMSVQTADGDLHPIVDVIMNPMTWSVTALKLDLRNVERGATCEIPVRDVGPLAATDGVITTPQRTEALLDVYRSDRSLIPEE